MRTRKDTHTHTHIANMCTCVCVCVWQIVLADLQLLVHIPLCVFLFYFDIIARTQMSSSSWPPPRCLLVRLLSEASVQL